MKPVIVFDVNETLLDMSALDPTFANIFDEGDGADTRQKWFQQVLELFLTSAVIGKFWPFEKLADDALQMIAWQRGGNVGVTDRAKLEKALLELPGYQDVRPGLERLKGAGFTLATLTNSAAAPTKKLLGDANVRSLFDEVLSVHVVKRYKPARETYEYAAGKLDVDLGDILLVAAHAWDIAGAQEAGCKTAFIRRPQKVLSPGVRDPEFTARDIVDLAEQVVVRHG